MFYLLRKKIKILKALLSVAYKLFLPKSHAQWYRRYTKFAKPSATRSSARHLRRLLTVYVSQ
jgi:hypothetical protein